MKLTKFSLLKRRSDLTQTQFCDHWRHTHVQVLVEQGGHKTYNRRYVQNHFIHDSGLPGGSEAFDGAAQMVPQSIDVLTHGFQEDPRYRQFVRPDEDRFLDVARCVVLYGDSHVLREGAGPYKLLTLLRRQPALTHAQFMQVWRERHGPLLQGQPDVWRLVQGYTQHEVLQDATRGMAQGERGDPAMAYDGVSELRFHSLDDLRAALAATGWRDLIRPDEATFVSDGSHAFVAREAFIYDDA